jgi:hypothetical protein
VHGCGFSVNALKIAVFPLKRAHRLLIVSGSKRGIKPEPWNFQLPPVAGHGHGDCVEIAPVLARHGHAGGLRSLQCQRESPPDNGCLLGAV